MNDDIVSFFKQLPDDDSERFLPRFCLHVTQRNEGELLESSEIPRFSKPVIPFFLREISIECIL